MSEEEEVLWETSARHLCFRCFSQILTHFIADLWGHLQADISNSHCWGFSIQAGFWHSNLYCRFVELRLPRAPNTEVASQQFHTLLHKEMTKTVEMSCVRDACVLTSFQHLLARRPRRGDAACHTWLMPVVSIFSCIN